MPRRKLNYTNLFLSNKNYAILVIVQFISYFGAWFSQVGVYTMLLEFDFAPYFAEPESMKIWAVALASVFAFLPPIVLAPLSGVIIDSLQPKVLLLCSVFIEMFSVIGLLFIKNASFIYVLFALTFLRLAVASLYFQTQMSLLPSIFTPRKLKLANELFSVVWAVSYTAGMACAGAFIEHFGVRAAFMLDASFFAIALVLLGFLRLKPSEKNSNFAQGFLMAKSGLKYLFSQPKIMHLILLHALVGITAYDALINFLARFSYLGKVSFASSMLGTAMLIGMSNCIRACSLVAGPLVLSRFVNAKNLVFLYLAQGAGIALWAILQFDFYYSFIGLIAAGFFTSTIWSYTYTCIQRECAKEFYGRIIAYVDAIYMSMSLGITLAIGALFDAGFSPRAITLLMSAIFVLGAIYYAYFYRRYYEKASTNRR